MDFDLDLDSAGFGFGWIRLDFDLIWLDSGLDFGPLWPSELS